MKRPARQWSGLTLLEVVVVLGILGVLLGLSYVAAEQLGRWAGPQNAASDLSSALSQGRARAGETGSNVWLIVYEDINTNGEAGQGHGAWFLLEDEQLTFLTGAGAPPGALTYASFSPPSQVRPLRAQGQLLEWEYMDRYPRRTVRFGTSGQLAYDPPFNGLIPVACSFCSPCTTCNGQPRRGAAVFGADGSVRFFDGNGAHVTPTGRTAARRVAALALISTDQQREYLFAISSPVGFVGVKSR